MVKTLFLIATAYADKAEALVDSAFDNENIAVVAKPYNVYKIPRLIADMIENAAAE